MQHLAKVEMRRGPWRYVSNWPGWERGNVAAYRIWTMKHGPLWFQRHEWRYRDGSEWLEEWIASPMRQHAHEGEPVNPADHL